MGETRRIRTNGGWRSSDSSLPPKWMTSTGPGSTQTNSGGPMSSIQPPPPPPPSTFLHPSHPLPTLCPPSSPQHQTSQMASSPPSPLSSSPSSPPPHPPPFQSLPPPKNLKPWIHPCRSNKRPPSCSLPTQPMMTPPPLSRNNSSHLHHLPPQMKARTSQRHRCNYSRRPYRNYPVRIRPRRCRCAPSPDITSSMPSPQSPPRDTPARTRSSATSPFPPRSCRPRPAVRPGSAPTNASRPSCPSRACTRPWPPSTPRAPTSTPPCRHSYGHTNPTATCRLSYAVISGSSLRRSSVIGTLMSARSAKVRPPVDGVPHGIGAARTPLIPSAASVGGASPKLAQRPNDRSSRSASRSPYRSQTYLGPRQSRTGHRVYIGRAVSRRSMSIGQSRCPCTILQGC